MKRLVIAIDGPAGSGKSTTAKLVAKRLGFVYLDTGAMYRAITLKAQRIGLDLSNGKKLAELAQTTRLEFKADNESQKLFMDGEDVSLAIRQPQVTAGTSPVSAQPELRKVLVELQRQIAAASGIVAEGRDTTSVVFPKADLKIYLTASLDKRAQRRAVEYATLGVKSDPTQEAQLLAQRDHQDSNREASPLITVADAIKIDTSNLTIAEQVEKVVALAREKTAV